MAIGGSRTPDPMALPSLHVLVYPMHAKVVDQFIGQGVAARGSVFSVARTHGKDKATWTEYCQSNEEAF